VLVILINIKISQEAYDRILYVIGTQALEDIFVTEDSVKNMIRLENGEITEDEIVKEKKEKYQKRWRKK